MRYVPEVKIVGPLVEQAQWDALGGAPATTSRSQTRWMATQRGRPIAGLSIVRRSDDKHFISWLGSDHIAHRELIEAAGAFIGCALYATCGSNLTTERAILGQCGFEVTLTEEIFEVDFGSAQAAVERAWVPSGLAIRSADAIDHKALLDLDNRLRRLVPGLDGWTGTAEAFAEEFTDAPPYDPAAYLVARDERHETLVGLIRFWRNQAGPRLGMVAVLPSHRSTTVGPALLKTALPVAAAWGSPSFITETAVTNGHVYGRLVARGARRIGGFDVLRRGASEPESHKERKGPHPCGCGPGTRVDV